MATFVTEAGNASTSGGAAAASITPSGTNRVLYVVTVHYNAASDPTAVVFNGSESLTKIHSGLSWFDANGLITLWRLIAPSAVAANVAVTWPAGVNESSWAAAVYSGVNQSTPERTLADSGGPNSGSFAVSATSVSGDTVLGVAGYDASTTFSTSTGTIRSSHLGAGHDGAVLLDQIAAGASTSVNFTCSSSGSHSDIAWALIDAGGGTDATVTGVPGAGTAAAPAPGVFAWPFAHAKIGSSTGT